MVTNREPGTVDKDGNGDGNGVSVNGSTARSKQHPQTGGSADEICPLREQPFQAALGGDGSAPNDEEELAAKGDDVDMDQELKAQQEVEVTVDGEKLPANLSDWELVETLGEFVGHGHSFRRIPWLWSELTENPPIYIDIHPAQELAPLVESFSRESVHHGDQHPIIRFSHT